MFNIMNYQKAQHEIEQRRLELRNKQLEIALKQSQLEQEMSAVEKELRGLDQMQAGTEIALGRLDAPTPLGLTDYIRSLLVNTQTPLTARQIRDSCEAVGIKAATRRNLLIAVHTVLKRMSLHLKTTHLDGHTAYLSRPTLMSVPKRPRRRA